MHINNKIYNLLKVLDKVRYFIRAADSYKKRHNGMKSMCRFLCFLGLAKTQFFIANPKISRYFWITIRKYHDFCGFGDFLIDFMHLTAAVKFQASQGRWEQKHCR